MYQNRLAFYRQYQDLNLETKSEYYNEDTEEEDYEFIVTDFDMTRQANATFHMMGDDYKVASYGYRSGVKNIKATIPNPRRNIGSVIGFYDNIGIHNNYGVPICVAYKNYFGHGQIVGMDITLSEQGSAEVVYTYAEMQIDESTFPVEGYAEKAEYEHTLWGKEQYSDPRNPFDNKVMESPYIGYISYKDEWGDNMNTANATLGISNLHMSYTARYGIVDSQKNIVYYGNNPIQIDAVATIIGDDNIFKKKYNEILIGSKIRKLRQDENGQATIDFNPILWLCGQPIPITIAGISGVDVGGQVNYMGISLRALATFDDAINYARYTIPPIIDYSIPPTVVDGVPQVFV